MVGVERFRPSRHGRSLRRQRRLHSGQETLV